MSRWQGRIPAVSHRQILAGNREAQIGRTVKFPITPEHHLLKNHSYEMVLHRPVEPAPFHGKFNPDKQDLGIE